MNMKSVYCIIGVPYHLSEIIQVRTQAKTVKNVHEWRARSQLKILLN